MSGSFFLPTFTFKNGVVMKSVTFTVEEIRDMVQCRILEAGHRGARVYDVFRAFCTVNCDGHFYKT
jgi:hypothetical protein